MKQRLSDITAEQNHRLRVRGYREIESTQERQDRLDRVRSAIKRLGGYTAREGLGTSKYRAVTTPAIKCAATEFLIQVERALEDSLGMGRE